MHILSNIIINRIIKKIFNSTFYIRTSVHKKAYSIILFLKLSYNFV